MFNKLIAGALLAAAAAAAQATEVPVKKGAQAAAEAAPDDVICTYESSVGSHLKRRVCATRSAREEQARASQQAMESYQRGGGHGSGSDAKPHM